MSSNYRKGWKWHWLTFFPSVFSQYSDFFAEINNCSFVETETGAIFDTGRPYLVNMRKEFIYTEFLCFWFLFALSMNDNCMNPFIWCSHRFNCRDSNKTVHFKFDRFQTEINWDALIIGDPNASQSIQWIGGQDYLNANCISEQALIMHGSLPEIQRNTWVEARGITDFHIFFFRTVL